MYILAVRCHFGCAFCATGDIGLKRSLTSDEMTDQILYFHLKGHSIDSISFMGMGEALANVQVLMLYMCLQIRSCLL